MKALSRSSMWWKPHCIIFTSFYILNTRPCRWSWSEVHTFILSFYVCKFINGASNIPKEVLMIRSFLALSLLQQWIQWSELNTLTAACHTSYNPGHSLLLLITDRWSAYGTFSFTWLLSPLNMSWLCPSRTLSKLLWQDFQLSTVLYRWQTGLSKLLYSSNNNLCLLFLRWEMLQTQPYLSQLSLRSMISSWVHYISCSVSPQSHFTHIYTNVSVCVLFFNLSYFPTLSYRCYVTPGEWCPATCCIPEAVDLEAGWVLHH